MFCLFFSGMQNLKFIPCKYKHVLIFYYPSLLPGRNNLVYPPVLDNLWVQETLNVIFRTKHISTLCPSSSVLSFGPLTSQKDLEVVECVLKRVWKTSLRSSSWGNWASSVWRKEGSGGTSLFSTTPWKEGLARWGQSLLPCPKLKDEQKWPEGAPEEV